MKRVISLWFPAFATDRLCRSEPAWRAKPLATVHACQGGVRIAAANGLAQSSGIAPDMQLADARALVPSLKVVEADPGGDARALTSLASWCERYTPWTTAEGTDGIVCDVTGCAHLFGGEAALVEEMTARLAGLDYTARAGLADTPGAAWAAARFMGGAAIIAPGGARETLAALSVAALRLAADTTLGLERVGLGRIGELVGLARAPLAARFGARLIERLDQALGLAAEPVSPRRPVPRWRTRLSFPEPVGRAEDNPHRIDYDNILPRNNNVIVAGFRPKLEEHRVGAVGSVQAKPVAASE